MALFGRGKKQEETAEEQVTEKKAPAQVQLTRKAVGPTNLSHILVKPRITEKATDNTAQGVYVFEIATTATKPQVAGAIEEAYKVKPLKIRIARYPHKVVRNARTGKYGVKSGGKKAYVYLKPGDSISIM